MINRIFKGSVQCLGVLFLAGNTALSIDAQASPPIPQLPSRATQQLTGVVRIPKDFGIVPAGPGLNVPNALPCAPFFVAVLDPDANNKVIAVTEGLLEPGRDSDNFYTCKYSIRVRPNRRFYAIAGMGGSSKASLSSRWPMYVTDAWVGGSNNKPRRGYERGFSGKFFTLGNKPMNLTFDLHYAQVDPN